jgi:HAD superfamily hydrolase (TIGR01509 family)
MSKILLVAVDLDGTLINTKDALEQAFKLALKDLGVITNNLDYLKCGYSFSQICSKFGLMHEDIKKLRLLKDTYYSSNLKLTSINMPVLKLINSLEKNTKVGIVTNSRRYSAELVLKHHNLSRKIDHLITSDDIINPKPHPEPYLKMLEISGIDASNCIAIEDSEIGRQSSIAANITTFSINLINSSA